MFLTHLSLTNIRAFSRLDMDLPRRVLLLVGDNAQGKTSILEAIYYLATFSSFITANDRQMVNFIAGREPLAVGRIVADFQKEGHHHRIEARLIQEENGSGSRFRKEILVDGAKRTPGKALGMFNAVIFLPQMTQMVDGSPEERRRFINLALSQVLPGYGQALNEYQQVLTQRNALLKQLGDKGGDPEQLVYWDELLVKTGASLIHERIQALDELEYLAARVHQQLTHHQEVLRVVYQPSYDPIPLPEKQYSLPIQNDMQRTGFSLEDIRKGFLARLTSLRAEEIVRGMTTIGPHRDELRFIANGIDQGNYGSRGQIRTLLLSLKMAEVTWMKKKTGHWPVLMLDETLAELDLQRRADLMSTLGDSEQALLTTTDLNLFEHEFVQSSTVWKVESGQVHTPEQTDFA
jgi:DNA replication and repair protein RecF